MHQKKKKRCTKIPHIASYRTDSARTQTFVAVCRGERLHFHLVRAGALSGSHRRGWLSSDSTTSEGQGLLGTLCSPPHCCSIQAGTSLGPCTLYIYPSLGLFCQSDPPLALRLFPQASWQSREPNFRCPRRTPQDTRSLRLLQGCCKLLSLVQEDAFGCPGRSRSQNCSLTLPEPRRRAVQNHTVAQLCWAARAAAGLHCPCTTVGVRLLLECSH